MGRGANLAGTDSADAHGRGANERHPLGAFRGAGARMRARAQAERYAPSVDAALAVVAELEGVPATPAQAAFAARVRACMGEPAPAGESDDDRVWSAVDEGLSAARAVTGRRPAGRVWALAAVWTDLAFEPEGDTRRYRLAGPAAAAAVREFFFWRPKNAELLAARADVVAWLARCGVHLRD